MKAEINGKALARVLPILKRLLRSVPEHMQGVEIQAETGRAVRVSVFGCDGETLAETWQPANVAQGGSVIVDERSLSAVLKSAGELATLEHAGNVAHPATLTGAHARASVALAGDGLGEAFARLRQRWTADTDARRARFDLPAADIRKALKATLYAASEDVNRYNLNGCYFEPEEGVYRVTATDGHRLAQTTLPVPVEKGKGAIVRREALEALAGLIRVAGKNAAPVTLEGIGDGGLVRFASEGFAVTSQPIDGEFPNWRQVMPGTPGWRIVADRASLEAAAHAAQRAAHAARKANRGESATRVTFEGRSLTLAGTLAEGEWRAVADLEDGTLEPFGMNARYLREAAQAFKGSTLLALEGRDALSPVLIRSGDHGAGVDTFALVMPMRI